MIVVSLLVFLFTGWMGGQGPFDPSVLSPKLAMDESIPSAVSTDALEPYLDTFSQAPKTKVKIGENIRQTAEFFAIEVLRAIQAKRSELDRQGFEKQDTIVHFCTGKTPILGYERMGEILRDWYREETQELLVRYGLSEEERKIRPEMSRVRALALDAIFPQSSTAYYSYAFILNKIFDKVGILPEKRHLFHGDFYGDFQSLSAFEKVVEDVHKNGIKVRQFLAHALPKEDLQYPFLQAMVQQARDLSAALRGEGIGKSWFVEGSGKGAHVILTGVGPSYQGDGHIAFNEAYPLFLEMVSYNGEIPSSVSPDYFKQSAYIAEAPGHVVIEQAKARRGLRNLYVDDEEGRVKRDDKGRPLVQIGVITFGLGDLTLREDATIITIATDLPKSPSIQTFLEKKVSKESEWEYPQLAFRQRKGTLILDKGAAYKTRLIQAPWEFQEVQWDKIEHLFYWLSLETGKPVSQLFVQDWLGLEGRDNARIRQIREKNFDNLVKKYGSWEGAKSQVNFIERAKTPEQSAQEWIKLGQKGVEEIIKLLGVSPHQDDFFLADPWTIRELRKRNVEMLFCYLTPGYTAVSNDYVLELLDEIRRWDARQIQQLVNQDRAVLLEELAGLIEKELPQRKKDRSGPFPMSPRERQIRATALWMDLYHYFKQNLNYELNNPKQQNALLDFISAMATPAAMEDWSPRANKIVDELKTSIRIFEEELALHFLGVPHQNIRRLFASWYGHRTHTTGVSGGDMNALFDIVREFNPHKVEVNGEDFGDNGAHDKTERTTLAVLGRWLSEIPPQQRNIQTHNLSWAIRRYAGVWWRIPIWEAQVILVLSKEELEWMSDHFEAFYRSQADGINRAAPAPDAIFREPVSFGEQVRLTAADGRREFITVVGEEAVYKNFPQLRQEGSGILAMRTIESQDELNRRGKELQERAPVLKTDEDIFGPPPPIDLKRLTNQINAMKENGITDPLIHFLTGTQSATDAHRQIKIEQQL